jgi:hypothetical protein
MFFSLNSVTATEQGVDHSDTSKTTSHTNRHLVPGRQRIAWIVSPVASIEVKTEVLQIKGKPANLELSIPSNGASATLFGIVFPDRKSKLEL